MSGFSRIYIVGGEGGFMGADGVNPIELLILVGDADRQWLEPHYFNVALKPRGDTRRIVPASPNHPDMILDACLAFAPSMFTGCRTLAQVERELGDFTFLDFHAARSVIPKSWNTLREEARAVFEALPIWEAQLVRHQR
jgi:hypothetical protein